MALSRGFRTEFQNVLPPDHKYDKHNSILIVGDDVDFITKITPRPDINALRFDEKSFFNTFLGFSPHWDYRNIASYDCEYYSEENRNFNTINKNHLKCDVIHGSIQDGLRQPILFSFVLDKRPGCKVFREPGTLHYKKLNKSLLNTITFYLEDDNNKVVDFNRETLTFTLKLIKL